MKSIMIEMLVTKKINLLSFFFGKGHTANKIRGSIFLKVKILRHYNPGDLDRRISITKSEDFYKVQNVYVNDPFIGMSR